MQLTGARTVLGLRKDKVKLGFTGSPHVAIYREEAIECMANTNNARHITPTMTGRPTRGFTRQGGGGGIDE